MHLQRMVFPGLSGLEGINCYILYVCMLIFYIHTYAYDRIDSHIFAFYEQTLRFN